MTQPLWTWEALCEALALPVNMGAVVSGVQIDSRLVRGGDLFIALKGDPGPRFTATDRSDRDGYDYVAAAMAAGAVGAIVAKPHAALAANQQLLVADTLDALWQLGEARRRLLQGPVIAVTGSSGKTTCKTFLQAALQAFASEGSLNNHLGVPLSLARTPLSASASVYELGMNHPGEIAPLSQLVRPQVAVVLNVHDAHAEAFADRDGIRREKLSICEGLEGDKALVVDERVSLAGISSDVSVYTFGVAPNATVQMLELRGDQAVYRIGSERIGARVPGGGEHRALTLAAVLAVLTALGEAPGAAAALSDELVPRGRGTRTLIGGIEVIDDSYNANPASVAAALAALETESGAGKRYALLGEMLELGPQSTAAHAALAPLCKGLDGVLLVGDGMRALEAELDSSQCLGWWPQVANSHGQELLNFLSGLLDNGDKLLIKGSNRVFWKHGFVAHLCAYLAGENAPEI
ncbi:MAG: UDP-N-acetylmuramoyl-tripeptide--D-alanyl-D-alanine ligase [Pseudomonadales bacterium]